MSAKFILKVRKMRTKNGLPVYIETVESEPYSTYRKAKEIADIVNSTRGTFYRRAQIVKV